MNQLTVDLNADPQVMVEVERMQELVPEATPSQVFRAAVRYFAESAAKYEQEVYIREQAEFEAQVIAALEMGGGGQSNGRAGYSQEEWTELAEALLLAPINMIMNVGQPGMIKTVKEFGALMAGINVLAKEKYRDNPLIQTLLADLPTIEPTMNRERLDHETALARLHTAAATVDRVTGGQSAREYKQFLIDLTQHVAEAAGEGFMGSGETVSPAEVAYIKSLKASLGLA